MVGGTFANDVEHEIETIQGEARIHVSFVVPDCSSGPCDPYASVYVAFTDIYNLDARQLHVAATMEWEAVVRDNGTFSRADDVVDHIEGRFYGPGHAEVGGVFYHPTAFGAKRQ